MEEPILFIGHRGGTNDDEADSSSKNGGGEFFINEDAVELLNEIEGNVAVISIAGVYRTGKSFILNQLAGSTRGFDIGASVEPCTQGIWMWIVDSSRLEPGLLPPHLDDLTVILLDTEGLASYTKTKTYDIQVFSLALLLSSFFVYNSMGNIDESALDRLSLVAELAKFIKLQSDGENDTQQLQTFFPAFMWLVRDFSLELLVQGEEITPDDYLEQALQPVKGDVKRVGGKNKIRESIKGLFTNRTCFTLKRPVEDEAKLQELGSLSMSDFRPEYMEQVKILIRKIYYSVKTKKLFGSALNGIMLGELARNYVNAINEGSVPTIRSAWENVLEIECKKALGHSERLYEEKLKSAIGEDDIIEEEQLEEIAQDAEKAALIYFRLKAVGGPHPVMEQSLRESFAAAYKSVRTTNRLRSSEDCEMVLDNLSKNLADMIRSKEIASIDSLQAQWESIFKEYEETARGPMKKEVMFNRKTEFFSTARRVADSLLDGLKQTHEKELEEVRAKAKVDYARLDTVYKTVDTEWKRSQKENQQLSQEVKDLDLKLREMAKAQAQSFEKIKSLEKQLKDTVEEKQRIAHEYDELESKEKTVQDEFEKRTRAFTMLQTEKEEIENRLRVAQARKKKCVIQ